MKLWLISQTENTGCDVYDSAVVAAATEQDAKETYPEDSYTKRFWDKEANKWYHILDNGIKVFIDLRYGDWTTPNHVTAKYLGETELEPSVICSSFNAG